MPKRDPQIDVHLEWIGFVRSTGLVVSAPALVRAGAVLPRDPEGQRRLRVCVAERRFPTRRRARAVAARLPGVRGVGARLELPAERAARGPTTARFRPSWRPRCTRGGEVLRPDFAVREREPATTGRGGSSR